MKKVSVTVDTTTIEVLVPYGDGKLSEGIRRSARLVKKEKNDGKK